ncbi:PREDICTED: uncharacterized protein LOC109191652 isoform X2 [Ipomoea nil]|uniref:uncharacterized protein LOC109191652 isoform X2 n=1 Tax=Ipomoea nil TaxID=35883 RepID=UPI000900E62F|nr:PREDICTED: uncharacterized protein LOC109191652 isoform X2 [Ipomoea nil]
MELTTTTQSLSHSKIPKLFSNGGATVFAQNSVNFLGYNCLPRNLQCTAKHLSSLGAIHASEGQITSTAVSIKWLLEPVGDGDTKHIGYPTAMPGAFEISSGAITVGRVSEKADMVIPVPTGDTHLAIFRVSKLEKVDDAPEEQEDDGAKGGPSSS